VGEPPNPRNGTLPALGRRGAPSDEVKRSQCSTGNTLSSQEASETARALLVQGLRELDLTATAAQIDSLLALAALLARWSQRMNLTGYRTLVEITGRLILGAAALAGKIPSVPSLADIGSGAGLPGLPLAILRPECRITLVESRLRRHHFQRAAVRELRLERVLPRLGRSEDLTPEPHAAVVAQALAQPAAALEWMLPWAEEGGLLLLPGSRTGNAAPQHPRATSWRRLLYRVPCGGPEYSLWIGTRSTR